MQRRRYVCNLNSSGILTDMWRYEIRDDQNRLLELRREYLTQQAAQKAGEKARAAILQLTPGRKLAIVTADDRVQ